ncbi:4-hydroxy-3-methylbut-2-enyl diphosphate reductase [hydrothermal vent metagenome]|uniref:4-hydroxy-3-methylbut-2-enyl diphosphate reductase n=1 Tax=hydrothermal vent metagenome TaxID=652676 RepID=A0A3B1C698_9ZZZZ
MTKKEEIKVAKTAGFCWGVKRAMDMTLYTAKTTNGPVYTHGPLIHNPHVIKMLENEKVFALDDATGLESGTVIIRTHGVTPQVRNKIKERGLKKIDATCPLVAKVQGIIKKQANKGFHTVIVGDRGHAEVIGLTGYAKGRCNVIESVDEVSSLPQMDKVCVVAQTTCDTNKYEKVVDALKTKYPDAVIGDTICEATQERQAEVLDMAEQVDLMVVVGGRNSANTSRLAQLAEQAGAQTMLIESEEDIDLRKIKEFQRIGLTAGASTPSWMIQRVLGKLRGVSYDKPVTLKYLAGRVVEFVSIGNLSVAVGAAFMVFANATLAGYEFTWAPAYIASAYLFAMYALNQLNDSQTLLHNEPEKTRFYLRRQKPIKYAAIFFAVSSLVAVFAQGWIVSLVYVGALVMGLGYTVKWFPKSDVVKIHRLKDIPASKDIFVGVAWVSVTVLIPALFAGADIVSAPVAIAAVFTFTIVYIRSVVSDIRDIHGDRLVGRETIPILIGKEPTKVFVAGLTIALALLLATASSLGWAPRFGYFLILTVGYTALYLALYHARIISRGVAFDLTLDGAYHVSGLLAIAWVLSGAGH